MMSLAGFGAIEKYALAGQAIQLIDKIPDHAFVQTIEKNLAPNSRANALALLVHAAAMGLDRSTERALRAMSDLKFRVTMSIRSAQVRWLSSVGASGASVLPLSRR